MYLFQTERSDSYLFCAHTGSRDGVNLAWINEFII